MNQAEAKFWALLKSQLEGYPTRIENVIGAGFPDVVLVNQGYTKLIELKVEKLGWVYFRSSQIIFFARVKKVKGTAWILTRVDDDILLTNTNDMLTLKGTPYKSSYLRYRIRDIRDVSSRWGKPWNWKLINQALFPEL